MRIGSTPVTEDDLVRFGYNLEHGDRSIFDLRGGNHREWETAIRERTGVFSPLLTDLLSKEMADWIDFARNVPSRVSEYPNVLSALASVLDKGLIERGMYFLMGADDSDWVCFFFAIYRQDFTSWESLRDRSAQPIWKCHSIDQHRAAFRLGAQLEKLLLGAMDRGTPEQDVDPETVPFPDEQTLCAKYSEETGARVTTLEEMAERVGSSNGHTILRIVERLIEDNTQWSGGTVN